MYRRIEIISKSGKGGLCFMCYSASAMNAWIDQLRGPGCRKNCRYFFTERGWREVGRVVASLLRRDKERYRIIKVKEKSVDVMAGDELEVAVRQRKRRVK